MERQLPLTDYARNIDLHPDILHQALTGHLKDSDPLNVLAKAINRNPEQLDLTILPSDQSFDTWLKRNMEGITQHSLRARAQLDRQTLKRFLNGDLLPDSDQAERISRALYIDRLEIARVVTANMAAASPAPVSQESPELGPLGHQSNGTTATEDSQKGEKRPKRARKQATQPAVATVAITATRLPDDEGSSVPAAEVQETGRDDGSVATTEVSLEEQELQPTTQSAGPSKSRSRRKPKQAIPSIPNVLPDVSTNIENEQQPTMKELAANVVPAEIASPKPDEHSVDVGMDRTVPLVTAELAVDTTSLQLSQDEVRLIRHWRQLHPHGRRATLQYIGSLLVEE